MKIVLTIAGSDSGGGAGLQADLRVFSAHGVHGCSAVAAITAQSSVEIKSVTPLEPRIVVAQIEAVANDMQIAAAKTGMLATGPIVEAVAEAVSRLRIPNLVVDPVMVSSNGDGLLEPGGKEAYVGSLFRVTRVLTPNLKEAEILLGGPVQTLGAMREAARALRAMGPRVVVVKGGHLRGDPIDVYFDGEDLEEIPGFRVETPNSHGTGCTFSAAIAARLAKGHAPLEAVKGAKLYLAEALRRSYSVGRGPGPLGHPHPSTQE